MYDSCNKEGDVHFQLCEDAGNTYNKLLNKAMGLGSAPSVIACVGPDDETLDERIGYYGEKIVLFAQQIGINTCWAGTFNKKNIPVKLADGERLVMVSRRLLRGPNGPVDHCSGPTVAERRPSCIYCPTCDSNLLQGVYTQMA